MIQGRKPKLKIYECEICDKTWLTIKALKIHAQNTHHMTITKYNTYEIKTRI